MVLLLPMKEGNGEVDKTCFTTVANKPYHKYIPWYVYFIRRSYPQAYIKIFLNETIDSNIMEMLYLLPSPNVMVYENYFAGFQCDNADNIKCMRWLNNCPDLMDFEYIHIGDVDMGICQENPTIFEQHAEHCNMTGLPYSNFVRPVAPKNRFCGVHVIKTKEWFDLIAPSILKHKEIILKHGKWPCANPIGLNEQLLYQIIHESIGIPPTDLRATYDQCIKSFNHHGVHIRLVEHRGAKFLKTIKGFLNFKEQLITLPKDEKFQELLKLSPSIGKYFVEITKCLME